jgi:hypothetical protein
MPLRRGNITILGGVEARGRHVVGSGQVGVGSGGYLNMKAKFAHAAVLVPRASLSVYTLAMTPGNE